MNPHPRPIPTVMPTQMSDHPADVTSNIALPKTSMLETDKVDRLTVQLQYVLITMGEMRNVATKLTTQMFSRPKLSHTTVSLIFGYTFLQKMAEENPANIPQAIAAPIFMQVPATGPYRIAPIMVPIIDSRIPILRVYEKKIEKMQVDMTLALRAKKVPKNASCHTQLLAYQPVEGVKNFKEKKVVVAQKERNRKKVPIWARIDDMLLCLKQRVSIGFFIKILTIIPKLAAKRQTLDI